MCTRQPWMWSGNKVRRRRKHRRHPDFMRNVYSQSHVTTLDEVKYKRYTQEFTSSIITLVEAQVCVVLYYYTVSAHRVPEHISWILYVQQDWLYTLLTHRRVQFASVWYIWIAASQTPVTMSSGEQAFFYTNVKNWQMNYIFRHKTFVFGKLI